MKLICSCQARTTCTRVYRFRNSNSRSSHDIRTTSGIMSFEIFHSKELDVEEFQIREVLQCIFHTIVCHRALGLMRPKEIDLELFDITYVQCGDVEVERKIDEKITQFIDRVKKHPIRKHQISLAFYHEVKHKETSWFINKVERHYWEYWYINLCGAHHPKADSGKSHHSKVLNLGESSPEERDAPRSGLELSLREVLFQIINFGSEKKDHIPPVSNLEGASFPFEITISSSQESAFGMVVLKRMLQRGRPTMLG